MSWSVIGFGKHSGKNLPQVLFVDPDWFFWAIEADAFKKRPKLLQEAIDLHRKAKNIRIPPALGKDMEAQYFIHVPSGKFSHFDIVPASQPQHDGASPAFRSPVIDLSVPRQISRYDKLGCKRMVSSIKEWGFGNKSTRMSKKKCEDFFDNDANFCD